MTSSAPLTFVHFSEAGQPVTANEKFFLSVLENIRLSSRRKDAEAKRISSELMQQSIVSHNEVLTSRTSTMREPLLEPTQPMKPVVPKAKPAPSSQPNSQNTFKSEENTQMDVDSDNEVEKAQEPAEVVDTFALGSEFSERKIQKKRKREVTEEELDEAALARAVYIFPSEGTIRKSLRLWDASTSGKKSAEYPLPNCSLLSAAEDANGKNAMYVKVIIPEGSSGWAFNIHPLSDKYFSHILFHFNPRFPKEKKHVLVTSNKYGTWGDSLRSSLNKGQDSRGIKAQTIILKLFIQPEGFLVFANDIFVCFFPHRGPHALPQDLKVVFPAEDANGKEYALMVDQIWWGRDEAITERIQDDPDIPVQIQAGLEHNKTLSNVVNPMLPRTIVVENMPVTDDLHELQGLEYMIMDNLEPHNLGNISISLVRGADFGYVRLDSTEAAQQAIAVLGTVEFDDDQRGMSFSLSARFVRDDEIGREEIVRQGASTMDTSSEV